MFGACLCLCLMSLASDSKTVYQCELKIYGQKAGVARVLSNPVLRILNGKAARMIIIGGEEPIPNTLPIQFEPTGAIVSCLVSGLKGDECQVDITFSNVSKQPSTEGSLITNQKSVRCRGKWKLNEFKTLTLGDVEELKDVKLDLRLTIVDPATLK